MRTLLPMPAFAAEMGLPRHRNKLLFGTRSGYAIVAAFSILTAAAHFTGIMPVRTGVVALIALKLVTNTAALIAIKRDRFALELGGLNVFADILTMTGAIHWTGGILSPLLPIYGIELTVIALLTNVGVTVSVGAVTFICYASMIGLERFGVIDTPPAVFELAGVTDAYRLVALGFVAFVLAMPTAFAAAILRRLRDKEEALIARNEQVVEAGKQKSQFMANVTHELRTPIHGICGLADLVASGVYGPVTEKQRNAVRDIKGSAQGLLRLIDDLLTLARDDAGRLVYRPVKVDPNELLESVMATVEFLRGTRELEVKLETSGPLPEMYADRGKLAQVLVNLLANAVKFTPDGGHVVLRARCVEGERIELSVIDDGIGIPKKEQQRIFEAFRQVDGSTERVYGGAGLGLALVQRLCALMGSELHLESEEGHGSTFTVTMPLVGPEPAANSDRPVAAA